MRNFNRYKGFWFLKLAAAPERRSPFARGLAVLQRNLSTYRKKRDFDKTSRALAARSRWRRPSSGGS